MVASPTVVQRHAARDEPEASLRQCVRDLLALSTLPAIWVNADPHYIAESLAKLVVSLLDADFACVLLGDPKVETIHCHDRTRIRLAPDPSHLRSMCRNNATLELEAGCGQIRTLRVPIGREPRSALIAASGRPDFPSNTEQMLMRVAANQAAISLQRWHSERRWVEQTRILEKLNRTGAMLTAQLDQQSIMQMMTDVATELTGAQFGAYFHNVTNEQGESYMLYTLSGAPKEAFSRFPMPRNTAIFEPTFRGGPIIRSGNIRKDPRYGQTPPHYGMPARHLAVTSYLAAPVKSRTGEVLGGLFFGHAKEDVFTAESELILSGIAVQAAIALDNARLYEAARLEILRRQQAERRQAALYRFTDTLHRAHAIVDIYEAAVDTMVDALQCDRASILLFDTDGVMRFVAWRRLSSSYRAKVEGHSPWTLETKDPTPLCISDVDHSDLPNELKEIVRGEGIRALAFVPLVTGGKLIGKFMTYYDAPHVFTTNDIDLAIAIARQLAFGIERKRSEEELRQNEERLRLATKAGKIGLWEWDIPGNRILWTDSLYTIHGVPKQEFGHNVQAFAELIHPEDRDRVMRAVERSLNDGAPYEVEFRAIKPDGQVIWVFTNALVFRENGNPARMLGATFDITQRKQADTHRNLLVEELSHRVKNTLATVIAIARQSFSKSGSFEDARTSFCARIHSLGQTHSRLADSKWLGVSLEQLVSDEIAPYRDEDCANVVISGPSITLDPKSAVSLGLAIHELTTNAAKYGALSTRQGSVQVSWGAAADKQLRIQWKENGGPKVTPPQRSGFGRLLLERALSSDLRGIVALDFAEDGLKCTIEFPLPDELGWDPGRLLS